MSRGALSAPSLHPRRETLQRYPSLLLLAAAIVLAALALPSSLVLPQASPGQTLEYAPVPPNGQAPPGGNLSALGLGTSGALGSGGAGGVLPDLPAGQGGLVSDKACVGTPPRQTEDPLSPPCVAYFKGANGGATYGGVTSSEIRIVIYRAGGGSLAPSDRGSDTIPTATLYNLWDPPTSSEPTLVTNARAWQTYFGNRFQTYGRRPHLYVYFGSCASGGSNSCITTADTARTDAAQNFATIHPFATLDYGDVGNAYLGYMTSRGVMSFGGLDVRAESFYSQHEGLAWGYPPSAEEQAALFASYLCAKVEPYSVSFSGDGNTGARRVYGMISSGDPSQPGLSYLADQVERLVSGCGIQFRDRKTFPLTGYEGPDPTGDNSYAVNNMAEFRRDGVTTIVWAGGFETQQSAAAATLNYYPEWITWGGDHRMDQQTNTAYQDQSEWAHAYDVTPDLLTAHDMGEPQCDDAYRSVDAQASAFTIIFACSPYYSSYDDLRQLFTGVQVSGPDLTPARMDEGFHAIPGHPSSSPSAPACFYPAGDYTCVKDAMAEWWDPLGTAGGPLDTHGCWRAIQAGARHEAGAWPAGDVRAQDTGSDACNTL